MRRRIASVLLLLGLAGCGGGAPGGGASQPGPGQTAAPLLIVGVDGLEWEVLLELLAQEKLPTLAALMERGTFGRLETFQPTSSPIIWTSIATSRTADEHGIAGFVKPAAPGAPGPPVLYTSADRRAAALWNILSEYGKRVCVVGWWMTFPAEAVNGVMVSQTNTVSDVKLMKGQLLRGVADQVYPAQRQDEMLATLEQSEARVDELTERIFGKFKHPLGPFERALWESSRWAFRADATYHEIARRLVAEKPGYDVTMVYLGAGDVLGHRFWRYYKPELYAQRPRPGQIEDFGQLIPRYYMHLDHIVSELLAAAPPDTTLLLISDHGMRAVNLKGRYDAGPQGRGDDISAHHRDAPPGVLIAAGPHIARMPSSGPIRALRAADLQRIGTVMDITPTVLAWLRIPAARNMRGRVLVQLTRPEFEVGRVPAPIATHDSPAFLAGRRTAAPGADPGERERIRQLEALGYVGEAPARDD